MKMNFQLHALKLLMILRKELQRLAGPLSPHGTLAFTIVLAIFWVYENPKLLGRQKAAAVDASKVTALEDKVKRYEDELSVTRVEATDDFKKRITTPCGPAKPARNPCVYDSFGHFLGLRKSQTSRQTKSRCR